MLTECFMTLGFYGDCAHTQRLDDLEFRNRPNRIVFRRSVPHGEEMPDIVGVCRLMKEAGYEVIPVITVRDKDVTVRSQINQGHVGTEEESRVQILEACYWVNREFAEAGLFPRTVFYGPFVKYEQVRQLFFASLDLPLPTTYFRNENLKHVKHYEWSRYLDLDKIGDKKPKNSIKF